MGITLCQIYQISAVAAFLHPSEQSIFHIPSVLAVIWMHGKGNAGFISRCLFSIFRFCALLNFSPPVFVYVAETDDYAEIVDEEDTYTMPSSK